MASVTLEGVSKAFGENVVVRGVDLTIPNGEFVVLVGPSGCGKSTTLRMIAGLEDITAGTLKIGDRVVNDLTPRDRDVAMVFQSYALYPHMSVYDNISFGLRLRKMPKDEIDRRVRDAAQKLGLTELLDRKPKAMSGGQRQRVAMGRAIVRQPAVFLFDEPLSNLDAKLRVQMRAEIARMHRREGVTTIYVTHDQVEAMTLADRIVVMNLGVVQQVGAPLELYRTPTNLFVAGFIGSPAMNFFDVTRSERGGAPIISGHGVEITVPERLHAHLGDQTRLVLGVRPEHLREAHGDPHLTARVDMLEPLGAEVHALGELDGQPLVASLDPDTRVRVGDPLPLRMDLDQIHLFDRDTGLALGRRPYGATP